ncbi:MAG: hypothetical protein V4633_04250 [Pseudomonadota bacterium]
MKKIAALVFLIFCFSGYWNYYFYQKKEELAELAKPFQAACQIFPGCIISPNGWERGKKGAHKDSMTYRATPESFEIRWDVATDVELVATGGRGKKLVIEKIVN